MNNPYKVGGTLEADFPIYVEREADSKLEQELKKGYICYVFNARQSGKSSLQARVSSKLIEDGYICAFLDFSSIGTQRDNYQVDKWYSNIFNALNREFALNINLKNWLEELSHLSNIGKLEEFFEQEMFRCIQEKIIIFIDEIDSVKSLPFSTDDFFAFIRACYNKRANLTYKSKYERLNFCLLGVTKPSDLIADAERTPFNVGKAIELSGFKIEEAEKPLITDELKKKVENPEAVLREVLKWTNGQPFLTQKLLSIIIDKAQSRTPNIDQLVQENIIDNWEYNDEPSHLKDIEKRIINREKAQFKDPQKTRELLNFYKRILQEREVKFLVAGTSEADEIQLSGLVYNEMGKLRVYCPIYEKIFNVKWIEDWLNKIIPDWYKEKKTAWLESNKRDVSCRLYGWELKYVFEKGFNSLPDEQAFVWHSDTKYKDVSDRLLDKFSNDNLIINTVTDAVIYWTKYQPNLLGKLIEIIKNTPSIPVPGIEDKWVDDLVKEQIINKWQDIEILNNIHQAIKKINDEERFWLLVTYRNILTQDKVEMSGSSEEEQLLKIGLVVKRAHYLKVFNPIYKEVFNQEWIETILPDIRGYGKQLANWLLSQEKHALLSKQQLQDTVQSLAGQQLRKEEHQFLIRSQILNQRIA